jgi:hypothetical protein
MSAYHGRLVLLAITQLALNVIAGGKLNVKNVSARLRVENKPM